MKGGLTMLTTSIVLLVIEVITLGLFIYFNFIKKRKIVNISIFFLVVFLINFVIYYAANTYVNKSADIEDYTLGILSAFINSILAFAVSQDFDIIKQVINTYPIFVITFTLGTLLAALTTITTALQIFSDSITNTYRRIKISFAKEIDFVFGATLLDKEYIKKYQNTVMILSEDTPKEDIKSLIEEGFCVIKRNLNHKHNIFSLAKSPHKRYEFIYFSNEDNDDFIILIDKFKNYLKKNNKQTNNISLHLEIKNQMMEYIKDTFLDKEIRPYLFIFSRSELSCRTLFMNDPIIKYFPKQYINEDTSMKEDIQINIFMIGFGDINQEIYKDLLITAQYVKQDDKYTYHANTINYHIYDHDKKKGNVELLKGIEDRYKKLESKKEDYFPLPERLSHTTFKAISANDEEVYEEITNSVNNKKTMNYIFIAHGDNFKNLVLSSKLEAKFINDNNLHIYTRITDFKLVKEISTSKVTYFGDDKALLTHDRIINHRLNDLAYHIALEYSLLANKKKLTLKDFYLLPYDAYYSNIISALDLRSKLLLMGYDYIKKDQLKEGDIIISIEEYNSRLGIDQKDSRYENYFTHDIKNAIIARTHLLWNAQYLLNEYLPLPKKEVKYLMKEDKPYIYKKDRNKKLHASLTSFLGLDELHQKILKEYKNNNIDVEISEIEVYKYDFMMMNIIYKVLERNNFVLIKRREM